MKDNTLKLSGHSKDRFLERFFADEPGLTPDVAQRLTARSKSTFASLRVRKIAVYPPRPMQMHGQRTAAPAATTATTATTAPPPAETGAVAGAFDPYAFGLVPTFQREGRDGLIARLGTVDTLDQLRLMAKSQQIVLPQELRSGTPGLDTVRAAIADAVGKRIADRRAAAG